MIHVSASLAADEARIATLPQLWRRRCAEWSDRPALRHKERGVWQGLSWNSYFSEARAIGLAMADAGLQAGDVVSVLSDNRPRWLIVDMGAQAMGYVSHGMYPCSTAAQVGHALVEAGSRVVFVENADQLVKVLAVRDTCPDLRHIVVLETRGLSRFTDPQVSAYDEWLARGTQAAAREPVLFDSRIDAGTGDQIAFLACTAGSTGPARLVARRQHDFLWEVRALSHWLQLRPGDRTLSIMSLAHYGERMLAQKAMLMHETLLHLPENGATVFNDMSEVEPHFLFAAPRFFEKLQGTTELFMQEAVPVARTAYASCLSAHRPGWLQRRTQARIRSALGLRNVRVALASGASSPAQVADWFDAIGVPLLDCYGMAEAGFCRIAPASGSMKTASAPFETGTQLKLARDGEVLVRGAIPRPGYWVRGTLSAATLADGWLRTGDLGRVDEHGRVQPLGRVRARAIGTRGESISPEIAEDAFRLSAYIADAIVVPAQGGHSAALLSLDEERIRKYAQQQRLPFTDYASLLGLPEITALIAAQVDIANGRLPENHRVRTIRVIPRSLHQGDEELTPALRLNRSVVASRYANLFTEPLGV
ncbi:AMP-binding protein [Variovorax sp. J22G21]|uniref:AMP-dependent synthetase/ligase n=1 Tax=Variovorax fucosicus TaxID=3053517 RepID=UPI0025752473|nr:MULTISPECIES: AMP-binding protein [unclassified Variovorax]MDM0041243.1 AMP-binding protein [Variovorax sp. J22R193]MDM0060300.1 AMP-binding protein [Variovorax sp. J22G21]